MAKRTGGGEASERGNSAPSSNAAARNSDGGGLQQSATGAAGIRYDNGTYVGELKDGEPHGEGRLGWDDGAFYDGGWKGGEAHGTGTCTVDGDVYEGDFVDGLQHGTGIFTFTNGNVYKGQVVEGKPHGRGTLTSPTGVVYEGEFKEGGGHGMGAVTYSSGDIYEGVWTDGERESKGTMKWANGDIQRGYFDRPGGCKLRSIRSQQRRIEADKKACEHCGVDDYRYKLRVCSGCNLALYCSFDCQEAASGSHRRICDIISDLPPRDAGRLVLEYDKDKMVDLDAGMRYGTKYMDEMKHLEISLRKMVSGDVPKLSGKQLSSLLRSLKGVLETVFWFSNAFGYHNHHDICENDIVWRELHGVKQLRLEYVGFDGVQPLCDIIDRQKDTLEVLCLPWLRIDWSRAKTRRAIALAVSSCKHLVKLGLHGCVMVDSDLKMMLQDLPNLRILHLAREANGSHDFTDNTCGLIARKCPSLQDLNLACHDQLSVRGVRKIFEGCPHLRAFSTTTSKLGCNDIRGLLNIAPQLLFFYFQCGVSFSTEELDDIIEATGGRTVLWLGGNGSNGFLYEPTGEGLLAAKAREKYNCQRDLLNEMWSKREDPEVANEWAGMFEG